MTDLYQILGIPRTASEADVKKAYRKLAKDLHPDRNKDNPRVAERFKEISAAYGILRDPEQRARYDRGEIDEQGNERGFAGAGAGGGGYSRAYRRAGPDEPFDMDDASDIFSEFFRFTGGRNAGKGGKKTGGARSARGKRAGAGTGEQRGLDITYEITVGFEESITGGTRRLRLSDGRAVDIKIPAGIQNGQVIRLAKQGGPGMGGGPKGDALVEVRVAPHPYYHREGLDIHLDLPISIDEAVLGGDIDVPTPRGRLTVRIPKNSSSGRRLRLKGKGVIRGEDTGNMYVTLKIMLPSERNEALEKLMQEWPGGGGKTLRRKAGLA